MIPLSPHWASEINNLYRIVLIIRVGVGVVQKKSINHEFFIQYYIMLLTLSQINISFLSNENENNRIL